MSGENVIAVSFVENRAAYEAFSNLKELDRQRQVSLRGAAVVDRDEGGRLVTKDEVDDRRLSGTTTGGLIGLVIGVLGGPFGILIGGATGLLIGSLFDSEDAADEGSVLAAISNAVKPGQTALIAELSEPSDDVVDSAMAKLGGTVLRRTVDEVEAEIAAADDAQKAAKHEARKKLHAERRSQLKAEIHQKVEAMKARQQELRAEGKQKVEELHAKL
jgi:uncharacterized membrane protein